MTDRPEPPKAPGLTPAPKPEDRAPRKPGGGGEDRAGVSRKDLEDAMFREGGNMGEGDRSD